MENEHKTKVDLEALRAFMDDCPEERPEYTEEELKDGFFLRMTAPM